MPKVNFELPMLLNRLFKSTLGRNIFSNYLSAIWVGSLSILFIPLYLKMLSPAGWGVVALCLSMQAFWSLLDVGLSQVMPRDVARVLNNHQKLIETFSLFAKSYMGIAIIAFLVGQLTVNLFMEYWAPGGLTALGNQEWLFRLVYIQFLFQFSNNAHTGYWNGTQMQGLANLRLCIFSTAKHIGALSLMYLWKPDPVSYGLSFAFFSFIEWFLNRKTIFKALGLDGLLRIPLLEFKKLLIETGILAFAIFVGMLISQVDRIVLSKMVSIESFGRYVIVASLGLAFMQLQNPLVRAFFPKLVTSADVNSKRYYKAMTGLIFITCMVPCLLVALLAPNVLDFWLSDRNTIVEGVTSLRLILIAVAINAIYQIPYQRIILKGMGFIVLKINLIVLTVILPLIIFLTPRIGISAGGVSWVVGALIQFTLGIYFSKKNQL